MKRLAVIAGSIGAIILAWALQVAYEEYRLHNPVRLPSPVGSQSQPTETTRPDVAPATFEESETGPNPIAVYVDIEVTDGKFFVEGRQTTIAEVQETLKSAAPAGTKLCVEIHADQSRPMDNEAADEMFRRLLRIERRPGYIAVSPKRPNRFQ